MTTTPITNIAPALARAQKQISVADKNAINEEHKSRYADLASIISSCRDALADQEISILQPLSGSFTELRIQTVLLHSSGEFLDAEFVVRPDAPNDTDAVASLVTKYRRYGLQSLLCIATQDDDGQAANGKKPAKKDTKPAPVQEKGPVIEKHESESPETEGTPSTEETVSSSKPESDDWKEVVCHYGSDTSPAKGHKLGDLTPEVRKWLAEKVLPVLGKSKKDKTLAAAIEDSQKADSSPVTATDTIPDAENAQEAAPSAKKGHAKEPAKEQEAPKEEPMDWRSVVATNFKPAPKTTLGEIADSKPNQFAKDYDAEKLIRGMKKDGIKNLREKQPDTPENRILINAILAANEEMDLREDVINRFGKLELAPSEAAAHLIENGIMQDGETLESIPPKLLGYIVEKWDDIQATIK